MVATLCDNCQASGLPILPVRYVPVPNSVKLALPGWASGHRVTDVSLGSEHHYALRTLRAGFVYLFFSKNARGSNVWECFSVSEDGCLMKQPSPGMAQVAPAHFQCSRQGHSNARLHHLVIEKPEKCGPTWIAFSEHKWSDEALKEYTNNTKLRNARMQTIHPAAMAGGAKHSHGTPATEAALNEVIEYAASFSTDQLPHGASTGSVSKPDGSFDPQRLERQSTRYPWHQRQGQAADDMNFMRQRAKKADGTSLTANVLALWDAIGVVHELNGFRNDAAGWVKLYGHERELEISAFNAIEGVKKALEKDINSRWDETAANVSRMPDHQESGMRRQAVMRHSKGSPEELGAPLVQLEDKYRNGRLSEADYRAQRSRIIAAHSKNPAAMEAEYAKIDEHRAERARTRAKNLAHNKREALADSWSKYEDKLDSRALDSFRTGWNGLLARAHGIIDRRTEVLVRWLEAPLFIDTLEDFHSTNLSDGVLFEDAISDAIFGIGSSQAGAHKIDQWVREAKASVKSNLLWRAIALNQQEGIDQIDDALLHARNGQALDSQTWANVGAQVKWNKIADLHKKAISLFNANRKAGVSPVNARGVDKLFITVGDAFLKPVTKVVDTIAEKTIQTILLIRAGASVQASLALVDAQARLERVSRARLIQRINTTKTFVAGEVSAERAELNKRWLALRATADTPDAKGFSAIKELRLGLVVAVLEGVNLWKISSQVTSDPKVQWQLRAAKMATSAACLDVVATAIKGIHSAKDLALSFQVLKVAGGMLSGGASFIGGWLDTRDANRRWDEQDYAIAVLHYARAGSQFIGGGLTIVVAVSYAAPLLQQAATRYAGSVVISTASRAAAWAFAARAGLMFAGIGFSVATLAISIAIWYFSDDALQDWAEECAFGKKPQSKRFPSPTAQMRAFEEALLEVM